MLAYVLDDWAEEAARRDYATIEEYSTPTTALTED